jgi:DNA-directed RNA polymerase III subunit RPC1
VLGIEAARTSIIDQIKYTIGIYAIKVDIRHINILADAMTNKGRILGITRYGIAKMRDSPLMLASFEKTADILFDSAYFGKTDRVQGVSEKIILGDQMGLGTGFFDLLYDVPEKPAKPAQGGKGVPVSVLEL